MHIAIVKNNTIETLGELRELFPNTSFPDTGVSEEWMKENNAVPVTYWKAFDNATQKLMPTEPYLEEGNVYAVIVEALSAEEVATLAVAKEQSRLKLFETTIQTKLDEVAKEKDFNSDIDAASYSVSTNVEWKAEAEKFIAYRDAMWSYYYSSADAIKAGTLEMKDFTDNMPVIAW